MSGEINSTRENLLAVAEAVKDMADMLTESEGATASMSCSEVNSIVRVLAVAGHRDEAATLLIGHALGGSEPDYYNPDGDPEDNDAHGFLTALIDDEQGIGTAEQFDAAWRYVKAMVDEPGADEGLDDDAEDVDDDYRSADADHSPVADPSGEHYCCERCGLATLADGSRHGHLEAIEELPTGDPWKQPARRVFHDAQPDDDPEPGDRCKVCGKLITWVGPSPATDWRHA